MGGVDLVYELKPQTQPEDNFFADIGGVIYGHVLSNTHDQP